MPPRLWRVAAVSIGLLLSIAVCASVAATLFGVGDPGFTGTAIRDRPGHYRVIDVTNPRAASRPFHAGDEVALGDQSLSNRFRYLRQRVGDTFDFVVTAPNGAVSASLVTLAPMPLDPSFCIFELGALAFAAIGILAAMRRAADPVVRIMVALFLSMGTLFVIPIPWLPVWCAGVVLCCTTFCQVYSGYASLALATNFPYRSSGGPRYWLRVINPWTAALAQIAIFGTSILQVVYLQPPPRWVRIGDIIISFGYFAAITVAFVIAARTPVAADRKRVNWVGLSLAVGFSGSLVILLQETFAIPIAPWEQYLGATILAIPVGMGYAIVRHRVIDIGFVVNRALVFGTLSAIVVIAFMILEWGLSTVAVRVSHITSTSLELALALGLGFSMRSLHGRVDAVIDDLFFRDRHEAERALRMLAKDVGFIADPRVAVSRVHDDLSLRSGATFAALYAVDGAFAIRIDAGTTGTQKVSVDDAVLVRMRATRAPCALAGLATALPGERAFPMLVRDALVGLIVLGPKHNGEAYAPDEVATIEAVALALGNALDALQTAALKHEIARVLLEGASLDGLRRTVDSTAWLRGVAQPAGPLVGLGE